MRYCVTAKCSGCGSNILSLGSGVTLCFSLKAFVPISHCFVEVIGWEEDESVIEEDKEWVVVSDESLIEELDEFYVEITNEENDE